MKLNRFILFGVVLYTNYAYATPNFAREYSADCTTCHTMIPTLNETGKSFLRNGFRFSKEDTPTLKKIINPNKDESRPIPLAVMLSANYDTQRDDFQTKVKLYTGGTITQNLSFFGMTKENFNSGNSDNQELFSEESSKLYAQLNFNESHHVIRAGLISPLTQFGNIEKVSADAGLKGHNSSRDKEGRNKNHSMQKYGQGNQGNGQGGNGGQGGRGNQQKGQNGNHYKTPLQNASIGTIKGMEYSYLANNRLMALLSYGESIDKSNQGNSHGNSSQNQQTIIEDDSDDYQFMGGVQYKTDSGYYLSLIYNQYEKRGQENFSMLLPIEKSFDKFQLVSTLIYRDETDQEKEYYGMENALIYSLSSSDYLRGIVDIGTENSEDSYGLSLTYSKAYKYLLFHLTGATKSTEDEDEELVLGSVSLLF